MDRNTKSSKMDVKYEKVNDVINIYKKPRCYIQEYVYDKNFIYVGILDVDWTIQESDFTDIEEVCKAHNIIPIFAKNPQYHNMIKDILSCTTFKYTTEHLNHKALFEEYVAFNACVQEKMSKVVDVNNDVVWAQDYNFLYVLPQYKKTIQSVPVFNELFACIPFYEKLLDSIIKASVINFATKTDLQNFKTFMYKHYLGNARFPKIRCLQQGIDKDFVNKFVCPQSNCKNVIVIPHNSLHHLICLEKYINKYVVPVDIVILDISKDIENRDDVLKYVDFLSLKTNVSILTPKSNKEYYNLIYNSHIGFYRTLNDTFTYLNKHVIDNSEYDYEKVADEIYKKLHFVDNKTKIVPDHKEYKADLLQTVLSTEEVQYKEKANTDFEPKKYLDVKKFEQTILESSAKERCILGTSRLIESLEINETNDPLCQVLSKRVDTIILDYDGTLIPISNDPNDAMMTSKTKNVLLDLAKYMQVVICSGRSRECMDKLIPKEINVLAEHCSFHRVNGVWTQLVESENLELELKIASFYEKRTPNSFIETKANGFVFHYRNTDEVIGETQARNLYCDLLKITDKVKCGKKIVEVKCGTKADVIKYYKQHLLIAGDDTTDEDMFDKTKGVTIKVGQDKYTKAEYYVKDVGEFIDFLYFLLDKIRTEKKLNSL